MTPSPPRGPLGRMDLIRAPSEYPDQKDILVPYLAPARDVGTAWFRGLKPDALANILDLAGELEEVVHPLRDRSLTQKEFYQRLKKAGLLQNAQDKLVQIIGYNSRQIISLYHIWWSLAWAYNYSRYANRAEQDQGEIHESVAKGLNIDPKEAQKLLARRDISCMISGFLERFAKERKGEVMWKTAVEALNGNHKYAQLYYDYVVPDQVSKETGSQVNYEGSTEEELKAVIAKLKRDVGETVTTIEAKVTITEAEFEEK